MAAQSRGSAFTDAATVPLVNGRADDCSEKVCQAGGTAGVYGIILCKTEKFQGSFATFGGAVFWQYTARHMRLKDGSVR